MSQLAEVTKYIKESYGDEPEFLWEDFDSAIWRDERNRKWYAIVQHPLGARLGLNGGKEGERVPILNVRLDPQMVQDLVDGEKFLPAYHMNKKYWLTIRLDGVVELTKICELIDLSYQIIDAKRS